MSNTKLAFLLFVCVLLACLTLVGQTPPKPQQPMGGGGVNTGAPINYASKRTVGITDPNAPVVFEDVTDKTALANFKHRAGTPEKNYIFEVPSGGVAIFDYDVDGLPDIYLVNGSTMAALQGKEKPPRAALYHNLGHWKFEDVTDKAGVANERWGMGVAIGDYDNDGRPDLYVTNLGVSRLYHNNGDGTFTDVAEEAGVARRGWSTGATWGDYDGDGRLDLFVPGYVRFDLDHPPPPPNRGAETGGGRPCRYRGVPVFCGPRGLEGEEDSLYRQKPDGRFEEVGRKAGVDDRSRYYGMSSAFVDCNDDGRLDLIVTDDSTPNYLYLNRGDGTFEDFSYPSGAAVNED